jgi:hypothetical protein
MPISALIVALVLFVLFAHAGPTELAILAGASALCYFEVVFALRVATADGQANLLFRADRRSALVLARHKRPERSKPVFRNARWRRRAFPARPFVGRSRDSDGLDSEAAPIGFAFA